MMKFLPGFAALLLAACGVFYVSYQAIAPADSLKMPSGASENNGKLRREWQRQRLADPAA